MAQAKRTIRELLRSIADQSLDAHRQSPVNVHTAGPQTLLIHPLTACKETTVMWRWARGSPAVTLPADIAVKHVYMAPTEPPCHRRDIRTYGPLRHQQQTDDNISRLYRLLAKIPLEDLFVTNTGAIFWQLQSGSNMTGTNCDLFTHK